MGPNAERSGLSLGCLEPANSTSRVLCHVSGMRHRPAFPVWGLVRPGPLGTHGEPVADITVLETQSVGGDCGVGGDGSCGCGCGARRGAPSSSATAATTGGGARKRTRPGSRCGARNAPAPSLPFRHHLLRSIQLIFQKKLNSIMPPLH